MPKQIIRLLIAFAIFVCLFIVIKHFLVPESFGDIGHYRAKSIAENADHDIKFVGSAMCITCHNDIDTVKKTGVHALINCESCHGPGYKHVSDPVTNKLDKPDERTDCGLCHGENSTRPSIIKQVDLAKHNINNKCVKCHNPHSPGMRKIAAATTDTSASAGVTKQANTVNCAMCHDDMAKLKSSGVHKPLECMTCHTGSADKHQGDPSANKMHKPTEREFCGKCHGKGIATAKGNIKQIDLKEHNTDSKCIECHNPHSPWE
jgi:hypothetical protein